MAQAASMVFGGAVIVLALTIINGIHTIPEGHVGVYWRGGRLLDGLTNPGYHVKLPYIDSVDSVQITMQTDSVKDIPCGTSGGVMVYFDRIEVVNQLRKNHVQETVKNFGINYDKMWIFDKIHHEINQFCSSHTLREVFIELFDTLDEQLAKALQEACDKHDTGLDIIAVRVTKPRIPESVRRNYELIEAEKTNLFLAAEHQKVVAKEAETEANRARIDAEKKKTVREIELAKELLEKENAAKISKLNDEIWVHAEKARSDAAFYKAQKEAEANSLRLTPEFLQYTMYVSLSNNTKIFFGEKIPAMFLDPYVVESGAKTKQ